MFYFETCFAGVHRGFSMLKKRMQSEFWPRYGADFQVLDG
jgi:hypothetical protein